MQNYNSKFKNNSGFSLIELLVVIGIIAILSGIVALNYKSGQKQLALNRAASKLAQDIRRTQEMAMSAKEFQGAVPPGYGLRFETSQSGQYIIFADSDNSRDYTAGTDVTVETIQIEGDVQINALSVNPLVIIFTPPDPAITISPPVPGSVTLGISGQTKIITVNEVGKIEID